MPAASAVSLLKVNSHVTQVIDDVKKKNSDLADPKVTFECHSRYKLIQVFQKKKGHPHWHRFSVCTFASAFSLIYIMDEVNLTFRQTFSLVQTSRVSFIQIPLRKDCIVITFSLTKLSSFSQVFLCLTGASMLLEHSNQVIMIITCITFWQS